MSELAHCPATSAEYCCPGQSAPISQAVHLGRLARFYPACRQCPRRDETGTLSGRLVKRLVQTRRRGESRSLWAGEAAVGVYGNELTPSLARQLAAALGLTLLEETHDGGQPPAAIIAGDGRPLVPELLAAVSEGLRWSGCNVVDIGAASAACLAFAIAHLRCAGGIHLGNPGGRAETVGLRFWTSGPRPLSSAGPPESIFARIEAGLNRPTRKFGSLGRFQADEPYLAALGPFYHALRPLRFVLDAPCRPLAGYLQRLTASVACEPLPCPARDQLSEQVCRESAHFGVRLDADGETCQLWDEHGRPVDGESLLLLLAAESAAGTGKPVAPGTGRPAAPGTGEPVVRGVVVVEEATSASTVRRLRRQGHRVVACPAPRAQIYDACRQARATLGGGPSGRFWHAMEDHPVADALVSLTLLLGRLSRSDRPLSQVVEDLPTYSSRSA